MVLDTDYLGIYFGILAGSQAASRECRRKRLPIQNILTHLFASLLPHDLSLERIVKYIVLMLSNQLITNMDRPKKASTVHPSRREERLSISHDQANGTKTQSFAAALYIIITNIDYRGLDSRQARIASDNPVYRRPALVSLPAVAQNNIKGQHPSQRQPLSFFLPTTTLACYCRTAVTKLCLILLVIANSSISSTHHCQQTLLFSDLLSSLTHQPTKPKKNKKIKNLKVTIVSCLLRSKLSSDRSDHQCRLATKPKCFTSKHLPDSTPVLAAATTSPS